MTWKWHPRSAGFYSWPFTVDTFCFFLHMLLHFDLKEAICRKLQAREPARLLILIEADGRQIRTETVTVTVAETSETKQKCTERNLGGWSQGWNQSAAVAHSQSMSRSLAELYRSGETVRSRDKFERAAPLLLEITLTLDDSAKAWITIKWLYEALRQKPASIPSALWPLALDEPSGRTGCRYDEEDAF